jgi:WD40 repeat protein
LSDDIQNYGIQSQNAGGGLIIPVPESDIDNASLLLDLRGSESSQLFEMDVHPIDRKRFLTCGMDGTVRLFDLRSIKLGSVSEHGFSVNQHYGQAMEVTGAAFDDTGDRIAASVIGGSIHVLDANQCVDLTTVQPPGPNPAYLSIPGELRKLSGHHSDMTIKRVNWFGNFVVTGTDEGDIYFYDAADGTLATILRGHDRPANVVTVHREKRLLATSGVDDFAILWEPQAVSARNLRRCARAAQEAKQENDSHPRFQPCFVM